jgi:hypothetical protein
MGAIITKVLEGVKLTAVSGIAMMPGRDKANPRKTFLDRGREEHDP